MSVELVLVDQDRQFAKYYREILQENNFEVTICYSQEDGFKTSKQKQPSIIMTEILLEEGNGFELTKQLKKDGETRDIPVIFFSKLGEKSDVNQAFKVGASNYLIKQYNSKTKVLNFLTKFK